jgi:hypothetical protein
MPAFGATDTPLNLVLKINAIRGNFALPLKTAHADTAPF